MTYAKLTNLICKNNIPFDVILQSDSGWECSATEMDGVWYNRKLNILVFTQYGDVYDRYVENDDWELIHTGSEDEEDHDTVYLCCGCIERNVWGKVETGPKLCKDCSATYESKAVCSATKKKTFRLNKERDILFFE